MKKESKDSVGKSLAKTKFMQITDSASTLYLEDQEDKVTASDDQMTAYEEPSTFDITS